MSEKELKHYNAGHVWGRIAGIVDKYSGEGTPYLAITVECPNDMFGNVKTYGRLWGQEKIDRFQADIKANPGAMWKLQGFFSQYDKGADRLSNYTFFTWQIATAKELRAAFVLVGEVVRTEKADEGGLIYLFISREGSGQYEGKSIDEDFQVYMLNAQEVDGLHPESIIKVKGVLRYREAEDYFGDLPEGKVRPYVMDMKVLREGRGEAF